MTLVHVRTLSIGDRVQVSAGNYGSARATVERISVGERRTTLALRIDATHQVWRRVYANDGYGSLISVIPEEER